MGQLTNLYVSQSYQGLIKLTDSTTGVTGTLQYLQDGLGNRLPIQMSTSSVSITGSLYGTASYATQALSASWAPDNIDSGSYVTTSSFNAFTASIDGRVDALEVETGSLQNQINGLATTSSLTSLSSSIAVTDLAQNNAIAGLATTSSLTSLSSSIAATDLGQNNVIAGLATTSSLTSLSSSIATTDLNQNNRLTSIEQKTGSYATTGSNIFNGNQTISGSLIVTGSITALSASITYLQTVYQTSSVVFSSGSNILGDEAGDTQTLWGRVAIPTGPVSVTGSVIATDFTGSLQGTASYATSASFASNGGVTQILAGPNITVSPLSGKGQVTISSTGTGTGSFNTATGSYGSFYDTTIQTNPVANTPNSMSFNETAITNGVSISGSISPFNTYIKTVDAGIYNIQFSAQVDKTDSGSDDIDIWIRKNGNDLLDTATKLTLPSNNSKVVAAWNWFVQSAANDYYQLIWSSADTNMRLFAEPSSSLHPGIPSVIATANRVDQFLSNTGSFTGSFIGSFTGSLQGTASFATNALSASWAPDNSNRNGLITTGSIGGSQSITGSVIISGNTTINGDTQLNKDLSITSTNPFGTFINMNSGVGNSFNLNAPYTQFQSNGSTVFSNQIAGTGSSNISFDAHNGGDIVFDTFGTGSLLINTANLTYQNYGGGYVPMNLIAPYGYFANIVNPADNPFAGHVVEDSTNSANNIGLVATNNSYRSNKYGLVLYGGGTGSIEDPTSQNIMYAYDGNQVDFVKNVTVTGSLKATQGITGSLQGNASTATSAISASFATNALSASYAPMPNVSGFATTGSNTFNGDQTINGNINALGNFSNISIKLNAEGSGSQYPGYQAIIDPVNYPTDIFGGYGIYRPQDITGGTTFFGMIANSYSSQYGGQTVPMIIASGSNPDGNDTAIGFTGNGQMDMWRKSNFKYGIDITSSLNIGDGTDYAEISYTNFGDTLSVNSTFSAATIKVDSINTTAANGDLFIDVPNPGKLKLRGNQGISIDSDNGIVAVTGSMNVSGGVTGSFYGDGSGLTGITATIPSYFATTGSNVFKGDETISGSLNLSGSMYMKIQSNTGIDYVTQSSTANANFLIGANGSFSTNSGSFVITGSNNIVTAQFPRTVGYINYINGHGNIMLGSAGVLLSTSSIATSVSANIGGGSMTIQFGTSSLASPVIGNNQVLGSPTFTSPSGSINAINNLFIGNPTYRATGSTHNTLSTMTHNVFNSTPTFNAVSSSIAMTYNTFGGGTTTINNNYTSSNTTGNQLAVNRNAFFGNSHVLNISGSNDGSTNFTAFNDNLLAGASHIVNRSAVGTTSGSLTSTALVGANLTVSASNRAGGNDVGSVFVGRNNDTAQGLSESTTTVFAVGTGTSTAAKRTSLHVSSSGLFQIRDSVIISGSMTVSGSAVITGSVQGNVLPLTVSSNTASLNLNNGNFFELALTGSQDIRIEPSNIKPGQTVNIKLNTTGSGTVSFPTSVKQPSGSAYVPTTAVGTDIITMVSFDSTNLYVANVKNLI